MRTTITLTLVIEGSADDAHIVVDGLLDAGVIQDAINHHDHGDAGPLRVVSAIVRIDTRKGR